MKIGSGSYLNLSKQDTSILVGVVGSFPVVVRVTDDDGQKDEDTMTVTVIEGSKSNADLASLKLSKGTLVPGFKPVTLLYSAVVVHGDSVVTLDATPADPAAKIAVNGKPVAAGASSDPVKLNVGTQVNAFQVVVTAQDGTQKIYAVSLTRSPSTEARLAKLDAVGFTLKPGFAPATLEYADTVAFAVTQFTLKPVPLDPTATVALNDSAFPAGSSAKTFSLAAGVNTVKIVVTAQDGTTKMAYRVSVTRRAKRVLYQKLGEAAAVALDSSEHLPGVPDSIKAPAVVGWVFQKWVVAKGAADIADSAKGATTAVMRSAEARIEARFSIRKYSITTKAGPGGVFSFASATVDHGKDTSVTITPLATHRLVSVTDNGKVVDLTGLSASRVPTYTLKGVTENHVLEAVFIRVFNISTTQTGNGKVDPASILADSGSAHTLTFVPAGDMAGNHLSSLIDNEKPVIGSIVGDPMKEATYKLEGIKEDHSITVAFAIKTFTLTVIGKAVCVSQPCPAGKICINPCFVTRLPDSTSMTVNYGTNWTISTADSSGGLPFRSWSGGPPTVSGNPATVSLTAGNATYRANYGRIIIGCPPICVIDPIDPIKDPILKDPILTPVLSPATAAPLDAEP